MKEITIHTDGGCKGNPGPGGWAAVLRYKEHVREISGGAQHTTNNRMELQAAIEALNSLKEACKVVLFTDSKYVRDGISSWIKTWKRNGWKTAEKKPVKNEDLWRRLDELTSWHHIEWRWVKGHAGNKDNERCDQLAQKRIRKMKKKLRAHAKNTPAPPNPNRVAADGVVATDVRRPANTPPQHPSPTPPAPSVLPETGTVTFSFDSAPPIKRT